MTKKRMIPSHLLLVILFSSVLTISFTLSLSSFKSFGLINQLTPSNSTLNSNWWSSTGNPICTALGNQTNIQMVRSGSASFIVWQDNRSGNWDIYAQRIDNLGFNQWIYDFGYVWSSNGIAICTNNANQTNPQIIPDWHGGIFITWQDNRSGNWDIFAQRVSKEGYILWAQNGTEICNASGSQTNPKMVVDNNFGAIISWVDERPGSNGEDIYAQRINSIGQYNWTTNGTVICNATGSQNNIETCTDGGSGAIITWEDARGSSKDVYAQKINGTGSTQWTDNGTVACNATGDQINLQIIQDGAKGCIIVWEDQRNANPDIYAQKINETGSIRWGNNGTVICNYPNEQTEPKMCEDGSHGAIISWLDNRSTGNYNVIFGQQVNSTGGTTWVLNGSLLSNSSSNQMNHQMVKRSHGAIIVWSENRTDSFGIYCQAVISGNRQYGLNGLTICDVNNDQNYPKLCSDTSNGAIIAWEDERSSVDIYAQRVASDGRVAPFDFIIPYYVDTTPNYFIIVPILIGFGVPLCTIFTYCLLQMRPKEKKIPSQEKKIPE